MDWVGEQVRLGLNVVRTAGPRLRAGDAEALDRELGTDYSVPVVVVLALDSGWLGKKHLAKLIALLESADRDIALVLADQFDPLDTPERVAGLRSVVASAKNRHRRLELLRSDLVSVAVVAAGGTLATVGLTTTTRHAPMPFSRPQRDEWIARQTSPLVLMPTTLGWLRGHDLGALAPWQADGRTHCPCVACEAHGGDLLRFDVQEERLPPALLADARAHDIATWWPLAERIVAAEDPLAELASVRNAAVHARDELAADCRVSFGLPPWLAHWS